MELARKSPTVPPAELQAALMTLASDALARIEGATMIQPNLARSSVMKMHGRRLSCLETRTCATNLASSWRCWTTGSARLSSSDSDGTAANRKLSKELKRHSG